MNYEATELLVWGVVAHIVADWMLQNDWMAIGKVKYCSPESWAHCFIHLFALFFVFPVGAAVPLALVHQWVDSRTPLDWYRAKLGQVKPGNPFELHVKIWQDQVVHVLCIAVAALIVGR